MDMFLLENFILSVKKYKDKLYYPIMNTLSDKRLNKGFACAEAAITLPLVIMLVITIIFTVVRISEHNEPIKEYTLTQKIKKADSIQRKADIIFETIFE